MAPLNSKKKAACSTYPLPAEVVVVEAPHLAAELERMPPGQLAQGVGVHEDRVGAPLRESGRPSEIHRPLNVDLRQPQIGVDAVVDAEGRRIELGVRVEGDEDPIQAEAEIVDHARAERVGLAEGEDLALRLAGVSEAGDVVPLQA